MPVSREKEKRMWQLADELARSGAHDGWHSIELELRERGYGRARQLLDQEHIRERLDRMCAESKKERSNAQRP